MPEIAKVYSAELDGIEARLIEVETDINVGLHSFTIVGLADKALSEAKERVNSALKNIDVRSPSKENRRIVVNLAPADVKKAGSQYDVAIALGYLMASEQITPFDPAGSIFLGELSLDGKLRPVNGALNIARLCQRIKFSSLFVPKQNAREAAVVPGVSVFAVKTLRELMHHLEGKHALTPEPQTEINDETPAPFVDISEIKGQEHAKRALTIAAAGGHNLLMQGPPGTGKTMLAQALASLMPRPSLEEVIEVTQIYSAAGMLEGRPYLHFRPFRSPHQTASLAAVVGGGTNPRPGEISLAHRGVLFLDELPEFRRDILEGLRQPLESGRAHISRVRGNLVLPAKFTLVAAMNPCPCGYYGDDEKTCTCAAYEILKYQKKISGPLLDRIDLQIDVPRIKVEELIRRNADRSEGERMRGVVTAARVRQRERLKHLPGKFTNAELTSKECDELIKLEPAAQSFLKDTLQKSFLSARGYYRILKTSQTIADLEGRDTVTRSHLAEAFGYRLREKE